MAAAIMQPAMMRTTPFAGDEHSETHAQIRRELAHALHYLEKGEYAMSEDCYAAALEQASAIDGESRLTATILGYLARACAAQGKKKMAATMYERQLLIFDGLGAGADQSSKMERASVLLELVSIYGALGKQDEADRLQGEVTVLMEGMEEPEAPPMSRRYNGVIDEDDDEDESEEEEEEKEDGENVFVTSNRPGA